MNARHPENVSIYAFKHLYLFFKASFFLQTETTNTTLYTNTSRVGWIIAGSVAGIVAEIWNYHAVFWFAMVMIIATLFCLLRIKDV